MLTAIPRHWLSWDFTLVNEGKALAEIDTSSWREKGTLTVSNTVYRVYREGLFSGAFVLENNGTVLARAEKASALSRRLIIDVDGARFELRPRAMFSRGFQLLEGNEVVGTLSPGGFLGRRMKVELSESLPLPIRAFMVWLAVLLWRRDVSAGG